MGAAERGYTPFVKFLGEHGADLSLEDARGRTALDLAKGVGVAGVKQAQSEGFPETAKLLESLMAARTAGRGGNGLSFEDSLNASAGAGRP